MCAAGSPSDFVVVLITCGSEDSAWSMAQALVEEKLAACANVVPGVVSCFRWKSELCKESECLLIAKSKLALFPQLVKRVKELHSYEVPEVIALTLAAGSEDYLRWLDGAVGD